LVESLVGEKIDSVSIARLCQHPSCKNIDVVIVVVVVVVVVVVAVDQSL